MDKNDRDGKYYDTRFVFDRKRQFVWKVLARWVQKRFIPADSEVLELGCGYCGFINNVRAKKRYGLDASPVSRQYADRDVVLKIGDAAKSMASCKAGCVDVVFASNFFEHLDEASFDKVLAGVKEALKPGGRLIVIQPNFRYAFRNYFDDYTHRLIFTHTGFCDRLKAEGFRIEVCRPRFLPFTVKSAMGAFYWLIGVYLVLPFKFKAGQMLVVAKKEVERQGEQLAR